MTPNSPDTQNQSPGKNSAPPGGCVSFVISLLILAVCTLIGFAAAKMTVSSAARADSLLLHLLMQIIALLLSCYIHIFIHELGHLVGGLCSGYRFLSFRIGKFMVIRDPSGGKLRFARRNVAGTGGQCLMSPPQIDEAVFTNLPESGKIIPFVRYNLGGVCANLVLMALSLVMYLVSGTETFVGIFGAYSLCFGTVTFLTNAVPLHLIGNHNDGGNTYEMMGNPRAQLAFHTQLRINAADTEGIRLRDMPPHWFMVHNSASEKQKRNSLISTIGVFAANRLLDEERFWECAAMIDELLAGEWTIIPLYRSILLCDRFCCRILCGETVPLPDDSVLKNHRRAMKDYIGFNRLDYFEALFIRNNTAEAANHLARFEKAAVKCHSQASVISERELIAFANKRYVDLHTMQQIPNCQPY